MKEWNKQVAKEAIANFLADEFSEDQVGDDQVEPLSEKLAEKIEAALENHP